MAGAGSALAHVPGERTLDQLRDDAHEHGLKCRSTMNKAQLMAALTPLLGIHEGSPS